MAKLFQMLKKMSVSVLNVLLIVFLTGCVTEYNLATKQQESLLYTTEREVRIGENVAKAIEEKYDIITDVDVNERVEGILDKIVAVCDRKDVIYFIKVIDEDDVNAASLPGGYIFLFRGLIDKAKSDDQVAGVIAHEVAHITAKHGIKRLQASYGALVLQGLAISTDNSNVAAGINLAITSLFMEYSQKDEFEADKLSVKYMKKAGYNPEEMITFLEILKKEQEKRLRRFSYWKTHPNIAKRIAVVNKEISGELKFKDYLNIVEPDDGYQY